MLGDGRTVICFRLILPILNLTREDMVISVNHFSHLLSFVYFLDVIKFIVENIDEFLMYMVMRG